MPDIEQKLQGTSGPDRFWTFGGISSEMLPTVISPLCWSVWEQSLDLAYRRMLADFGVLSRRQVRFADNPDHQPAAPFYGRLAINVDTTRELYGQIPGISANQFEREMLGGARQNIPEEPTTYRRLPAILIKTPVTVARATTTVSRSYAANEAWWQREVLQSRRQHASSAHAAIDALDRLTGARQRFANSLSAHIGVRFIAQGARRGVRALVERAGHPELADSILGGYGKTGDIAAADDLWQLAHNEIGLDQFLLRHGFRGTHEGNVYARSWREEPARVTALAEVYTRHDRVKRPGDSERAAVQRRLDAEASLIASFPGWQQPTVRWFLARAEHIVRTIQLGRAGYLMAVDGCRAAARDLGDALVAQGKLDETDDVFFLVETELEQLVSDRLPDAAATIARRRATRKEYEALELPPTFTGIPVPICAPTAAETSPDTMQPGTAQITGTSGNRGVVEGRALVILDPDQDAELEDGDILVCRATDPAWMALLALAAGMVIDNGGATSHGAIVSRELGIPCVIGTGNGTSVIPNGARIRVDGDAGTVALLDD